MTYWEELLCPELEVINRCSWVKDEIKLLRVSMNRYKYDLPLLWTDRYSEVNTDKKIMPNMI